MNKPPSAHQLQFKSGAMSICTARRLERKLGPARKTGMHHAFELRQGTEPRCILLPHRFKAKANRRLSMSRMNCYGKRPIAFGHELDVGMAYVVELNRLRRNKEAPNQNTIIGNSDAYRADQCHDEHVGPHHYASRLESFGTASGMKKAIE